MQQAQITRIDKYLSKLPDSTENEVLAFLGYLNYINNVDTENILPDEKASLEAFNNDSDTYSWNQVKKEL